MSDDIFTTAKAITRAALRQNAKDAMIEDYSQESPWLALAKRIVREDLAHKAALKEGTDEGVQRE